MKSVKNPRFIAYRNMKSSVIFFLNSHWLLVNYRLVFKKVLPDSMQWLIIVFAGWMVIGSCNKETLIIREPGDTIRTKEIEMVEEYIDLSSVIYLTSRHITENTKWSSAKKILISGRIYIDSNVTLTIDAGTLIQGLVSTNAAIIVKRGAQIFIQGTAAQPVVFTSSALPDWRNPGDIGGFLLCGSAPVNYNGNNLQILTDSNICCGGNSSGDNSGIIQYLRIEFAGNFASDVDEMGGLTLAGTGNGTVVDHVQVSYSNDDSFGWKGGTVNCRNLVSYKCRDDDFDTDLGYTGVVQFGVAVRDKGLYELTENSSGIESDNDYNGSLNTPNTQPVFSNISLFGPKISDTASGIPSAFQAGVYLRRGTMLRLYNSVIAGWPYGLRIQPGTANNAQNNATGSTLRVRHCVLAGNTIPFYSSFDSAFYDNPAYGNIGDSTLASLHTDTSIYSSAHPVFLPGSSCFILTGADFTELLSYPEISVTGYKGAFGTTAWTAGWAVFDPESMNY